MGIYLKCGFISIISGYNNAVIPVTFCRINTVTNVPKVIYIKQMI